MKTDIVNPNVAKLRETVQQLQDDRQKHLDAAAEIDKSLVEISQMFQVTGRINRNGAKTRKSGGSRSRNGKPSGTQIIEELLAKHNGEMASSELASAASAKGVKFPHSSYQSLKNRGVIEIDHGTIRLVK